MSNIGVGKNEEFFGILLKEIFESITLNLVLSLFNPSRLYILNFFNEKKASFLYSFLFD